VTDTRKYVMARWKGSTKAHGFCRGRSISIVEAELTTIAIHCPRGGSCLTTVYIGILPDIGQRRQSEQVLAIHAGTPRRFTGVRPADLSAKVMMAPEPVRPSWVKGAEPP